MALRTVRGLALCAGAGGMELGLSLALGDRFHPVCYVEREAYAAAVLVARMADASLRRAPVWDDVRSFDGRPWRGRVDVVTAGFPCQPFSEAGRRGGLADERWLWPDIARIVREVRPGLVFMENVRGFLGRHGGLGDVLGDLADCGLDAEWSVLSAAQVGATHLRERVWLLAFDPDMADAARAGHGAIPGVVPGDETAPHGWAVGAGHVARRGGAALADAEGAPGRAGLREDRTGEAAGRVEVAEPRDGRGALPLWPPGPLDAEGWRRAIAEGAPQPCVYGPPNGVAYRVDRLRVAGNGVVPLVAASAFLGLAGRAGLDLKRLGVEP